MNILYLFLGDLPGFGESNIYIDLPRRLRDLGHRVTIVSLHERRLGRPTACRTEAGVLRLRVRSGNVTKTGFLEKGLSLLALNGQVARAVSRHLPGARFELIICYTPPVTHGPLVTALKRRYHAPAYLVLKDIFPQNAIDLGLFGPRSLPGRYYRQAEKRLYAAADHIGCTSPANVDHLLENNPEIPPEKVEICPNGVFPRPVTIRDPARIRALRGRYRLPEDRVVLVYGGNLGRPQAPGFIRACLRANRDNRRVFFLLAGAGTEAGRLDDFIRREQLANARRLPQLPSGEYETLVSACDIGLIFLDRRFTVPNSPARVLTYLQASLPVLAATDRCTDLRGELETGGCGLWCESGSVEDFNACLAQLMDEKRRRAMGAAGRRFFEAHFTVGHTAAAIMKHFETATAAGGRA